MKHALNLDSFKLSGFLRSYRLFNFIKFFLYVTFCLSRFSIANPFLMSVMSISNNSLIGEKFVFTEHSAKLDLPSKKCSIPPLLFLVLQFETFIPGKTAFLCLSAQLVFFLSTVCSGDYFLCLPSYRGSAPSPRNASQVSLLFLSIPIKGCSTTFANNIFSWGGECINTL